MSRSAVNKTKKILRSVEGDGAGRGAGGSPVGHVVRGRADVFGTENSGRPWWSVYGMSKNKILKPSERGPQG